MAEESEEVRIFGECAHFETEWLMRMNLSAQFSSARFRFQADRVHVEPFFVTATVDGTG